MINNILKKTFLISSKSSSLFNNNSLLLSTSARKYSFSNQNYYNNSISPSSNSSQPQWHHTTILALKHKNQTVIIGDGQVSYGSIRIKVDGKKIRKLQQNIYCGFAGSLADAFSLMEGLQQMMSKYPKQTLKSCIQYAKLWRTGKALRHLQATLVVIDKDLIIELDGTGNVIEIDDVIGVGSGGQFAECAARALVKHGKDGMSGQQIALEAMKIAADKCIYTSNKFIMEVINSEENDHKVQKEHSVKQQTQKNKDTSTDSDVKVDKQKKNDEQ